VTASQDARRLAGTALAAASAAVAIAAAGLFAYGTAEFHGNPYSLDQLRIGAAAVAIGTYVAWRRADHPLGWLLQVAGMGSLFTYAGSSWIDRMIAMPPANETVARVLLHLTSPGWIVTHGIFAAIIPVAIPHGWHSTRARAQATIAGAAIAVTVIAHSRLWTFEHFDGQPAVGTARLAEQVLPWGHRAILVCAAVALVDLVVRAVRADHDERVRYRLVVTSIVVLSIPTVNSLYSEATGRELLTVASLIELWAMTMFPVVLAVGIVRHGALDIRVVVRRLVVYAALAILAGVVYIATVVVFAAITDDGIGAGNVVATGLVAIAVVPGYAWVQRLVSHRVFGNRRDPYEVVTALGDRLSQAPPGEEALHLVTATLKDQLRLPYVAVELSVAGASVTAAASGAITDAVEYHPLVHQGSQLGSLVVGWRTGLEPFRPDEHALIASFARQVGVIAHNAALSEALRRSRAVLLEAREQERLRIRRDLHDGLGATLASVSLGLGAAAERLADDDSSLAHLLHDLESELRDAVADIRRLVNDLRPPALDELGLADAVREHVETLQARAQDVSGTDVTFEIVTPSTHLPLPAPVELAAYRVALEAMTNVVRHAQATRCWVTIEQAETLDITVEDDGIGVPDPVEPGVGMRSMHDRVLELGGTLGLGARLPRGTSVTATFPLDIAVSL
jgi:two-component system NarL family sensor kinase